MKLDLDPTDPTPLYRQLADQISRAVASGALRVGERLPTIRELAAAARVNRNTAARAVRALAQTGLVRARVGRGTVIVDRSASIGAVRTPEALDRAIDRLLVEAHARGVPLEELGWRLSRRIDALRRERGAAGERP